MQSKARVAKGSPEAKERMAAVRQARQARETATGVASPTPKAPFMLALGGGVDVNEFTGVMPDFPQTSFGPNFLPDLPRVKAASWPGDKR